MSLFYLDMAVANPAGGGAQVFECLIEPQKVIELSSSELGVLEFVSVEEADILQKGEVIAGLHTDVERTSLEISQARAKAKSEIELLQRDYDFNKRNLDRMYALKDSDMYSEQALDETQTATDAAWLRLQAAVERQLNATLEAEREKLTVARRILYAPIDSVVLRKYKNIGEFVDGDPIVQLAQLDPLRISAIVPMEMFEKIKIGMQATIDPELPMEGPFLATVDNIDAVIDAATATIGMRLSLPNPDHRIPAGQKCTVHLHPDSGTSADISPSDKSSSNKVSLSDASSVSSYPSHIYELANNESETEKQLEDAISESLPRSDVSLQLGAALLSGEFPKNTDNRDIVESDDSLTEARSSDSSREMSRVQFPRELQLTSLGKTTENSVHNSSRQTQPDGVNGTSTDNTVRQVSDKARFAANNSDQSCLSIGPIKHESDVNILLDVLHSSQLSFNKRYEPEKKQTVPWIVLSIDPYENPQATVSQLKSSGLDDVFWLKDGAWKDRISYGSFSKLTNARNRLEEVVQQDLAAEIVQSSRTQNTVWLDIATTAGDKTHNALIGSIRRHFQELVATPIACHRLEGQ